MFQRALFATPIEFNLSGAERNVSVGDLDGDGRPEIVAIDPSFNKISILKNFIELIPPTITTYLPLDNASNVALNGSLSITFNESIQKGTGNILIKEGGTTTQTIAVTDASVTISGATATIDPANFSSSALVNIEIAAGAFKDLVNNNFAGISNSTDWNFTVQDIVVPVADSFTPLDNTASVAFNTNLTILFTENIQKGTGNITIKGNGVTNQTIAVTDSRVSISGNIVTINPDDFTKGVIVNIEMPAGIFKDLSNNNYAGITSSTAWNFTIANDLTPPTVTDNTITPVNQGAALTITANITDTESSISSASVEFRSMEAGGSTASRTLNSNGSTFTATINANEIGDLGIEYKLSATSSGGTFTSASFKSVTLNQANGLAIPYSSFGSEVSNYRIVAIPLTLASKSVNSVFDELGTYDRPKWRMYHYDNGATTELNGSSQLQPARGYWLIAKTDPGSAINSGAGTTIETSTATPYEITLKSGWNQIGNPYNFNLSWADVQTANPGLPGLRVYNSDFVDGTRLKKMEGGFVNVSAQQTLKFPVIKNASVQGGRQSDTKAHMRNTLDQPDWEVPFTITQDLLTNTISGFGMSTKASDGFDVFDGFNLPRFFETFVELNHDKKQGSDYYSMDIVTPNENYVWDFSVDSNDDEELIIISWDNSYFGTNNRELYLWDVKQQRAIDMRATAQYRFNKRTSNGFRAVYGSKDFVMKETSVDKLVFHQVWPNPAEDKISVSFSLPNNATEENVSFSLLDAMGRKIWQQDGSFNGGYNEGEWLRTSEVTSGTYVLIISNRGITRQSRVILK